VFQFVGRHLKFAVAVLGAVAVGFASYEHGQPWVATVLAAVVAAGVYFVPNRRR
jgi:uncharacterized membrane protein